MNEEEFKQAFFSVHNRDNRFSFIKKRKERAKAINIARHQAVAKAYQSRVKEAYQTL